MTDKQYSLDDIRLRLNELDDQLLNLLSERRKMSIGSPKAKSKPRNLYVIRLVNSSYW